MDKLKVRIKKVSKNAILPKRGSEKSAGYDLCALVEGCKVIMPHETEKISTGLSFQPPEGYFGAIFARSGSATKYGIRPANCVGVCDEDYTGEYIVALHNDSDEPVLIENGERIAQLIFLPYVDLDFIEVDELGETKRGSGGFGSTGV